MFEMKIAINKFFFCSFFIFFFSDRSLWKKCCFSGDGEYVAAGSARQHSLYVWEKSIGNLVKILHGTKGEMLLDLVVRQRRRIYQLFLTICFLLSWLNNNM